MLWFMRLRHLLFLLVIIKYIMYVSTEKKEKNLVLLSTQIRKEISKIYILSYILSYKHSEPEDKFFKINR